MRALDALRRLLFGETWTLPLGLVAVLVASAALRHAHPHLWHTAGGILLPAGTIAVLLGTVAISARDGRRGRG